ncbi:MAG TPA: pyridoxamine 5'-phosphate oxidase family protein [Bacteroidales bacterium]|nr:pyridoxamine 5'-phosphate oxidase family protein [Bacteroidales bacterium]
MRRTERRITDPDLVSSIFESADVCRIGFADGNVPYIVTMNFGYDPAGTGRLYFHCATEGRKMDMMKINNLVCFQLDTGHLLYGGDKACGWGMRYKSIVGYGNLSVVSDQEEKLRGLNLLMDHYGAKGIYNYDEKNLARTSVLRLDITEISGKQA